MLLLLLLLSTASSGETFVGWVLFALAVCAFGFLSRTGDMVIFARRLNASFTGENTCRRRESTPPG
eukprot:6787775-Pyramimonas_sp.AAC.1